MDETWWRSTRELDEEQRALIEIPTDEGHYLVTGPPGSGKTNVLLLRGSYLWSAGLANCEVLVFTRGLREFIAAGSTRPTMLPQERIKTHAGWTLNLLRQLGRPLRQTQSDMHHDEKRAERSSALEEAVQELGLGDDYYDSILLDEVQDYWTVEINMLARLTRRLYVVGDNHQRIYGRNEGLNAAVTVGCEKYHLTNHYRMGPKICRVADKLLTSRDGYRLEEYCQYDDHELPSTVSVISAQSVGKQLERVAANLGLQLRAYPDEWIGVLAVKRETRDLIARYLGQTGVRAHLVVQSDDSNDRTFDSQRRIVISTLHGAKGMEFRSVHFVSADDFPYYTREKAYTMVTRAKTTLHIYHSNPLDGSLESALAVPAVPDLEGILG